MKKCSCGALKVCDVWKMFKTDDTAGIKAHFGSGYEGYDALFQWREQKKISSPPPKVKG
jgi:hypothetical protein